MKITKKCPKCKSTNIVAFSGKPSRLFGSESATNFLEIVPMTYIEKQTYICCDCGYMEEWTNEEGQYTAEEYKDSKKNILNDKTKD